MSETTLTPLKCRISVIERLFEALSTLPPRPPTALHHASTAQHSPVTTPQYRGAWSGTDYAQGGHEVPKSDLQRSPHPLTGRKCTKLVRTVCACTAGLFLCRECPCCTARAIGAFKESYKSVPRIYCAANGQLSTLLYPQHSKHGEKLKGICRCWKRIEREGDPLIIKTKPYDLFLLFLSLQRL